MKQTILVADDSLTIQRLVTQTFADTDFRVISVSNGDAAVRKFEEIRPALVLADIYMPGKNGYEVCSHIKNHPDLGTTPVVLLVGAFDAFEADAAASAGAAAHITKPFEPRALVELVRSLLPQSAAEAVQTEPEPAVVFGNEPQALPVFHEGTVQAQQETTPDVAISDDQDDLLGLGELFKPPVSDPVPARLSVSNEEIERIADRVIQKLSTQVIESVAWDVVPDITSKVLRDELKRNS